MKPSAPVPNPPLTREERRKYRLLLFRKSLSYLGSGLIICAVIGGLYGDRMRFVWALCAVSAVYIAWGWWEYLMLTDTFLFRKRKQTKKQAVPYSLRQEGKKSVAKPSFLQKAEDFEDDLTPYTTADMEIFTPYRQKMALVLSRCAAGILLLAISFVIPQ